MKEPLLSVIIPHRNKASLLAGCFTSLQDQHFPDFQIILVDNGSEDDSFKVMRDPRYTFPKTLVLFRHNKGFARAVNEGIYLAGTPYIMILNNDVLLTPPVLEKMIAFMEDHKGVDVLTPRIMQKYNPHLIDSLGNGISKEGKCFQIGWNCPWKVQVSKPVRVFGVAGTCALFRRSAFDRVGVFDETYFMYLEDMDWALRAFAHDVCTMALPTEEVYHQGSASSGGPYSDFSLYWILRNQLILMVKNFPKVFWYEHMIWIIIGQWKSAGKALLIKKKPKIYAKALKDFLILLPTLIKEKHPLAPAKIAEAIAISERLKKLFSRNR